MLTTLAELRSNIGSTVRETQVNDLIDSFINLTALEIHMAHAWSWLRRKQTFATVTSQEDYNLDSEVDRIAILRQRDTPLKLTYLTDPLFYRYFPNPEDLGTGPPRIYRLWEETGFSTNLAAADTVYVVSSSASDGSSFTVRIIGRNSSGEVVGETLTLNGTTNGTGSTTWAAAGLMQISKSAATTGTISCSRTTGATLLAELEPDNLTPRYKRLSLYPIPSSVITMYLEYYERFRYLVHGTDVPQMDQKWNWLLREGTLVKMWEYKQKEAQAVFHQQIFDRGLRMMRLEDDSNLDYVPVIQPRLWQRGTIRRNADSVNDAMPSYSLWV